MSENQSSNIQGMKINTKRMTPRREKVKPQRAAPPPVDDPPVVVLDVDELIIPAPDEDEIELQSIPNEIVTLEQESYFPPDFRLSDIVLNSIAKKYPNSTDVEQYPAPNESGERFLIGPRACRTLRAELDCPYMSKVNRLVDTDERLKDENFVAIYLLDTDKSDVDVNRQKFILFARNKMYLRHLTNKVEEYSYAKLRFTEDGVEDITRTSDEGLLVDYPLDVEFIRYAQEFMQLRYTRLSTVGRRHPFADTLSESRDAYIEVLTEIAASEGRLTAPKYIRLEYLAREFRTSYKNLQRWLSRAYAGGSQGEVQKKFRDLLDKKMRADEWYVLFQDVLEMALREDGSLNCQALIKTLRRPSTAGGQFVDNYIEFIKLRREATEHLQLALESIDVQSLSEKYGGYLKKIHAMQSYNDEMILQMLDIAILTGEKIQ